VLTADGLKTPVLEVDGDAGAAAMRDEGGVDDDAEEDGVVDVAKGDLCLWEAAKSGDDETVSLDQSRNLSFPFDWRELMQFFPRSISS
jgi:hypothetical protein